MGAVKKYNRKGVTRIVHHMERVGPLSNKDIDPSRSYLNENSLAWKGSPMEVLKKRLSELYVFNRKDVIVLASWVFTLPSDATDEQAFWKGVLAFLLDRYGAKNAVAFFIHRDESTPHAHFLFVPSCYDPKRKVQKACANSVLTRQDLRQIHIDLQNYLIRQKISGTVYTGDGTVKSGITAEQGNKSVNVLKLNRSVERKIEHDYDINILS